MEERNKMENVEYMNSLYQISEILKYITPTLKARIPKKIISYIESNKSKDDLNDMEIQLSRANCQVAETQKHLKVVQGQLKVGTTRATVQQGL